MRMPKNVTCDWVDLDWGIETLLEDIPTDVKADLNKSIPKAARQGAQELRSEAGKRWDGTTGAKYSAGFTSHTNKTGDVVEAEIGNKTFPGLVHLLEKGHATLTGRRTRAYPHMAPVYEKTVRPALERAVGDAVDRALEG